MVDTELAKRARQILSQRKPDARHGPGNSTASLLPRMVPRAIGEVDTAPAMTIIEPAMKPNGGPLSPIYWQTGTGDILGPAIPEFHAKSGHQFWIVTTFKGDIRWINADRLRSKKAFETQRAIHEIELI